MSELDLYRTTTDGETIHNNADNTAKRQILNGTYRTDSHNVTTVIITRSLLYCKEKLNTALKILYHIEKEYS